ncbi:hypothetical protein CMI37_00525 [Candidatus Pacearchaeota archaeon]|nr:hypothetical protein [Candidatus Pacearchaeota archaeon]
MAQIIQRIVIDIDESGPAYRTVTKYVNVEGDGTRSVPQTSTYEFHDRRTLMTFVDEALAPLA